MSDQIDVKPEITGQHPVQNTEKPVNPLAQYYRQPKIFVRLPSKGEFYPKGSIEHSSNDEYPVFAMTAKDELMLKTPDALLNGQSTVEVIKSCVPAVINPWVMPVIDVDALLMAIRIATYGESMDVTGKCPKCKEEHDYAINLTSYLNEVQKYEFVTNVPTDPLTVTIRPYTYKEMTKVQLKAFEQQRAIAIVNDEAVDDQVKLEKFSESFTKLTDYTVTIVSDCISAIRTPDGSVVTDSEIIKDFIRNADKSVFDIVTKHIQAQKERMVMPETRVKCSDCEHEFELQITLDQANFFDVRS